MSVNKNCQKAPHVEPLEISPKAGLCVIGGWIMMRRNRVFFFFWYVGQYVCACMCYRIQIKDYMCAA
jgi:hypothetical protein